MTIKYSFKNDYSEGAHPAILDALSRTNMTQEPGYGEDSLSLEAVELIKSQLDIKNVDIHFVSGGTQTNLIALASMLKPYESVIAANTAHIAVHESGAIEATGHKINTIISKNGKLNPTDIQAVVDEHSDEHMVKPRAVFVSNSTEVGTIYTKQELSEISTICRKNGLYLYLDGARLGSALMADGNDLTLSDIAELTDMFYVGGTKNGALLGEALVIINDGLKSEFRHYLKQHGALLAKGRIIGAQFVELFKSNLFFDLAKNADEMANKLTFGIHDQGYQFLTDSKTNQIFPIFPNELIKKLELLYGFYIWSKVDDKQSSIRLVTSWATKESAVTEFLEDLKTLATQ